MHVYELIARGTVTCYAHPVAENCDARLPYEVPVRDTDDAEMESVINTVAGASGWSMYSHPGGMRYSPQWYCPRHVQAILDVPDDAEDTIPDDEKDSFARHLKDHLWPDRRR